VAEQRALQGLNPQMLPPGLEHACPAEG